MRYLFFDIECAKHDDKGAAICTFGYVITDEGFNLIEKEDIIINPQAKWSWFVLKKLIAYPREVFDRALPFSTHYDKIKTILSFSDQLIIGHSVDNDARYLLDEFKRYELPCIDFKFYDSQIMYKDFADFKSQIGLEEMNKKLDLGEVKHIHKSDDDAYSTMIAVKRMCELMEVSLSELIGLCEYCSGEIVNNTITLNREPRDPVLLLNIVGEGRLNTHKKNHKLFCRFLDNIKPSGGIENKPFENKKFCICLNYEENHLAEMLKLSQRILDMGGEYTRKSSLTDFFIKSNDDTRPSSRLKYVNEANENGSNIEIKEFNDFLTMLEMTQEELDGLPIPDTNKLPLPIAGESNFNQLSRTKRKAQEYRSKPFSTTIGDIFGDLLQKLPIEGEDNEGGKSDPNDD